MKIVIMIIIMMMVVDDANDSHDDNDDNDVDDNDDDNDDYVDDDRNHKQVKHTIDNVYSDDHDNSCIIACNRYYPTLPYLLYTQTYLPTDRPIEPTYSTYSTNSTHLPNNLPTSVLVRMDK